MIAPRFGGFLAYHDGEKKATATNTFTTSRPLQHSQPKPQFKSLLEVEVIWPIGFLRRFFVKRVFFLRGFKEEYKVIRVGSHTKNMFSAQGC